jgi:hypothetical protein
LTDLLINEGLERVGQGDIHGAHAGRLVGMTKFGKVVRCGQFRSLGYDAARSVWQRHLVVSC